MPRRPTTITQFKKREFYAKVGGTVETWHLKFNGSYVPTSGDKEIRVPDDIAPYVRIIDLGPRGRHSTPFPRYHIHFKGTKINELNEWKENYSAAFRGRRVPVWDRALAYVTERYGYDSRNGRHFSHPDGVHYTGFSRGCPLAMHLGGSGYGLGQSPFPAYPAAEGSDYHKVHDWYFAYVHDWFLTEHLPGNMEASQSGMDQSTAVYGKRPPEQTAVVHEHGKRPCNVEEEPTDGISMWMPAHDGRPESTIKKYKDGFWYYMNEDGTRGPAVEGQGFGNYDDKKAICEEFGDMFSDEDEPSPTQPIAPRQGDFSGLVTTLVNPVTSRIIGYKGIPRKRKFRTLTTLQQYSPFWKEQLTQPSVLVAPSQA